MMIAFQSEPRFKTARKRSNEVTKFNSCRRWCALKVPQGCFVVLRADGGRTLLLEACLMPTRIIREGILTSEKVNLLTERAELFYRKLMSVVDDYGRYFAHPSLIRAACYALRLKSVSEADVKRMISECETAGLLKIYGGGKHLFITNFKQQTRSPSKFPEPSENELLIKCKSNDEQPLMPMRSESEPKSETYPKAEAESFSKKTPSLDEVRLSCQKTGLTDSDAEWFWNKSEGNGWTNGGKKMVSWPHVIAAWKAQGFFPSQKQKQFGERPKTPGDLRTIIQAKETKAAQLRTRYCSDTAIDSVWSDTTKRREFFDLKSEIKNLTNQLSNMA
jgi:hypothetical protein